MPVSLPLQFCHIGAIRANSNVGLYFSNRCESFYANLAFLVVPFSERVSPICFTEMKTNNPIMNRTVKPRSVLISDYLTLTCHVVVSTLSGGRVESSSGLTYEDNMNCSFRVRVPDNKRIMLRFIRFELEKKRSGVCVDYLNIHDGDDLGASTLNTGPLCGEHKTLGNFTTSAGSVVLHFVTDQTAVYRGFDVLYHAFSSGETSPYWGR